jgi:protein SCO1
MFNIENDHYREKAIMRLTLCCALTLWIALFYQSGLSPCTAQSNNSGRAQEEAKKSEDAAHKYFTDVELLNQNGETMRFFTDLLQQKVVVINTFCSTCLTNSPTLSRNLEKIRLWLGDKLGQRVHIISITVDPTIDTPSRLKEYAKGFNAKRGWYFLTGKKENVDFILRKLGLYAEQKEEHSTIIFIGNVRTGLWKKTYGLANSDELVRVIDSVLNDKD